MERSSIWAPVAIEMSIIPSHLVIVILPFAKSHYNIECSRDAIRKKNREAGALLARFTKNYNTVIGPLISAAATWRDH